MTRDNHRANRPDPFNATETPQRTPKVLIRHPQASPVRYQPSLSAFAVSVGRPQYCFVKAGLRTQISPTVLPGSGPQTIKMSVTGDLRK